MPTRRLKICWLRTNRRSSTNTFTSCRTWSCRIACGKHRPPRDFSLADQECEAPGRIASAELVLGCERGTGEANRRGHLGASSSHDDVAEINRIELIEESVKGQDYKLQKYLLSARGVHDYHFGALPHAGGAGAAPVKTAREGTLSRIRTSSIASSARSAALFWRRCA